MIKATTTLLPHEINHYRNDHKYRTDVHCELFRQAENVRFKLPQLEKYDVLQRKKRLGKKYVLKDNLFHTVINNVSPFPWFNQFWLMVSTFFRKRW